MVKTRTLRNRSEEEKEEILSDLSGAISKFNFCVEEDTENEYRQSMLEQRAEELDEVLDRFYFTYFGDFTEREENIKLLANRIHKNIDYALNRSDDIEDKNEVLSEQASRVAELSDLVQDR
jgi:hypothetical protein